MRQLLIATLLAMPLAALAGNPQTVVLDVQNMTCPHCGFAKEETMPTDACQFYYECSNCKVLLRPKPRDCCVFCSFGSVKCPPMQTQQGCCG